MQHPVFYFVSIHCEKVFKELTHFFLSKLRDVFSKLHFWLRTSFWANEDVIKSLLEYNTFETILYFAINEVFMLQKFMSLLFWLLVASQEMNQDDSFALSKRYHVMHKSWTRDSVSSGHLHSTNNIRFCSIQFQRSGNFLNCEKKD